MSDDWGESTRSVHLEADKDPETGAIVPPISQSSAHAFDDKMFVIRSADCCKIQRKRQKKDS